METLFPWTCWIFIEENRSCIYYTSYIVKPSLTWTQREREREQQHAHRPGQESFVTPIQSTMISPARSLAHETVKHRQCKPIKRHSRRGLRYTERSMLIAWNRVKFKFFTLHILPPWRRTIALVAFSLSLSLPFDAPFHRGRCVRVFIQDTFLSSPIFSVNSNNLIVILANLKFHELHNYTCSSVCFSEYMAKNKFYTISYTHIRTIIAIITSAHS